jgi:hypothetical protein
MTQRPQAHTLMLWMAIGSFAVGVGVRVFAAHNDLWFDEVWTLQHTGSAKKIASE